MGLLRGGYPADMATICSWCDSADTQAGLDQSQCLACGQSTDSEGVRTVPSSLSREGVTVADVEKEQT